MREGHTQAIELTAPGAASHTPIEAPGAATPNTTGYRAQFTQTISDYAEPWKPTACKIAGKSLQLLGNGFYNGGRVAMFLSGLGATVIGPLISDTVKVINHSTMNINVTPPEELQSMPPLQTTAPLSGDTPNLFTTIGPVLAGALAIPIGQKLINYGHKLEKSYSTEKEPYVGSAGKAFVLNAGAKLLSTASCFATLGSAILFDIQNAAGPLPDTLLNSVQDIPNKGTFPIVDSPSCKMQGTFDSVFSIYTGEIVAQGYKAGAKVGQDYQQTAGLLFGAGVVLGYLSGELAKMAKEEYQHLPDQNLDKKQKTLGNVADALVNIGTGLIIAGAALKPFEKPIEEYATELNKSSLNVRYYANLNAYQNNNVYSAMTTMAGCSFAHEVNIPAEAFTGMDTQLVMAGATLYTLGLVGKYYDGFAKSKMPDVPILSTAKKSTYEGASQTLNFAADFSIAALTAAHVFNGLVSDGTKALSSFSKEVPAFYNNFPNCINPFYVYNQEVRMKVTMDPSNLKDHLKESSDNIQNLFNVGALVGIPVIIAAKYGANMLHEKAVNLQDREGILPTYSATPGSVHFNPNNVDHTKSYDGNGWVARIPNQPTPEMPHINPAAAQILQNNSNAPDDSSRRFAGGSRRLFDYTNGTSATGVGINARVVNVLTAEEARAFDALLTKSSTLPPVKPSGAVTTATSVAGDAGKLAAIKDNMSKVNKKADPDKMNTGKTGVIAKQNNIVQHSLSM